MAAKAEEKVEALEKHQAKGWDGVVFFELAALFVGLFLDSVTLLYRFYSALSLVVARSMGRTSDKHSNLGTKGDNTKQGRANKTDCLAVSTALEFSLIRMCVFVGIGPLNMVVVNRISRVRAGQHPQHHQHHQHYFGLV